MLLRSPDELGSPSPVTGESPSWRVDAGDGVEGSGSVGMMVTLLGDLSLSASRDAPSCSNDFPRIADFSGGVSTDLFLRSLCALMGVVVPRPR